MLDKAWSDMRKRYNSKKDEREIITLPQNQYDYLLKILKSELQNTVAAVDNDEEDGTIRSIAFQNIRLLKKYLDMLETESVQSEDGRIHIPFYKDFGNDLFLFVLANITGEHYII